MRATFFDGKTARAHVVDLIVEGDMIVLAGEGIERRHTIGAVEIPEAPGSAPRVLRFVDGASCEVRDGDELMAMLARQGVASERVSRWERSWKLAIASLVLVILAGVLGYQFGLPLLARAAADKLPPSALNALSFQIQRILDNTVFSPTKVPDTRITPLRDRFDTLTLPKGIKERLQLHFRNAESLGANAMALPSGDIFLTDEFVGLTTDDRVIIAVIAHEAGHVDRRHGLRQIIQSSAVGILVTWYLGDVSAVGAAAPAALLNAKYSRDLEREADAYATDVLRANQMPVTLLADALELLEKSRGRTGKGEGASYLSSHPATAERMEWIRRQ
jgi:Zn-dependent protease with chaperone function